MGQQQLLLVILVTIIVGIATVVAINIFGTAADQANRDAVRQDLLAATVQAQGIWGKPAMLGGAGRDFSDTDALTSSELLQALNIPGEFDDPTTPTTVTNENGVYSIGSPSKNALTINGVAASNGVTIQAIVCRDSVQQVWRVDIDSPTAENQCASS